MPTYSSPGTHTYDVPSGVKYVDVTIEGAGGSGGGGAPGKSGGAGGQGGRVSGRLDSVSAGDTIDALVGAAGSTPTGGTGPHYDGGNGGNNPDSAYAGRGGGGGASTAVELNGAVVAVADGGGGGAGAPYDSNNESGGGGGGGARGGVGGDSGSLDADGSDGGGSGQGGDGGNSYAGDNIATDGTAGGQTYDSAVVTDVSTSTGGGNSGDATVTITATLVAPSVSQTITGDDTADVTISDEGADHYELSRRMDGGSWTSVDTNATAGTTSYSVPSGDVVEWRVRSVSSGGESSSWTVSEAASTSVTPLSFPDVAGASFDLSWGAADDATEYDVLLAEASGSEEADYDVDQTVTGTTATVTGLENGERYFVRVVARYPGTDSLSPEQDTKTSLPSPTLDSIEQLSQSDDVRVGYTLNDNSSDGLVELERSSDGGSTWSPVDSTTDLSATALTDPDATGGVTYDYRVSRETDHSTETSSVQSFTPELAAASNFVLVDSGVGTLTYEWVNEAEDPDGYRLHYKPAGDDGATWSTTPDLAATKESHQLTGLRHGERYRAILEVFTSDDSSYSGGDAADLQ